MANRLICKDIMHNKKLKLFILLLISLPIQILGSGGFDNGTSAGKGRFSLDITWNPFNYFVFGQSYLVTSYGITSKFDIHSYISQHPGNYTTWYVGGFYQFIDSKKIDLATAIGIRKRTDADWTHFFVPQLLYTISINEKFNVGGSFVNIRDEKFTEDLGIATDITLLYKTNYESKIIQNLTIGLGLFKPATWNPENKFLPTYSLDITFK